MSKTIAVTGASGFTGGAIARYFHERGWRVLAFGRRDKPQVPDDIHYQKWDISLGALSITETVDVVVHSAAMVGDTGNRDDFLRANVIGTEHVLESFRKAGQFIHISSSSVYDPYAEKININEDFPYGKQYFNAYGESKMLAEKTVRLDKRANKVILRPRAIYGEGDTTLLPRLMRLQRGRYTLGIGNGNNEISITYIGNFCHAIECVTQHKFSYEVFNITDAQTITQRQLLERIANFRGCQFRPIFIPREIAMNIAKSSQFLGYFGIKGNLSPYGVHNLAESFTLDISKAYSELNYIPPYTQEEGFAAIQKTQVKMLCP